MESFIIQPYDLLMLAVLVGLAVLGAWKGVAWQIAALSSLVVSWIVAVRFGKVLAPVISDNEPWNGFIAMLLLYLGTSLAIWTFFRLIKGMIDRVQLKDFDRQMGALFGLVKGVLWCLLITFFAVTLSETTRQWVLQSRSGYYTAQLIQHGTPILPEDVRNLLGKYIQQLDEGLGREEPQGLIVDIPVSELAREGADLVSKVELPEPAAVTHFREGAREFGEGARDLFNTQSGELEREIDQGQERLDSEIREAMRRGIDELDSQIKRLPLEPVDR